MNFLNDLISLLESTVISTGWLYDRLLSCLIEYILKLIFGLLCNALMRKFNKIKCKRRPGDPVNFEPKRKRTY